MFGFTLFLALFAALVGGFFVSLLLHPFLLVEGFSCLRNGGLLLVPLDQEAQERGEPEAKRPPPTLPEGLSASTLESALALARLADMYVALGRRPKAQSIASATAARRQFPQGA